MRVSSGFIVRIFSIGIFAAFTASAQQTYRESNAGFPNPALSHYNQNSGTYGNHGTETLVHANQLIGNDAKNFQGQTLGNIRDVVFTENGEIFALLDNGNNGFVVVPWKAVRVNWNSNTGSVGGNTPQVIINATPESLQNAPSLTSLNADQITPAFVHRVFSYFKVANNNQPDRNF